MKDPTGETAPRGYLFEELFAKRYDESILDAAPLGTGGRGLRRALGRGLPSWARLAQEVQRRSDEYDVVVTWSERVTLSLMSLQRFAGDRKPHVAMLYWFSRPSVRIPMRAFGDSLHAIVTWSSVQRDYAIENLGVDPHKIYLIKHFVDQLFWSPRPPLDTDMICAAGAEMRDYPTLLEALKGTGLRCHVATDHVRVDRLGFARRIPAATFSKPSGVDVTIGRKTAVDLRALYARSRFVVVPLQASDTDNGVNVVLEAMAMGKPVICSKTRGQVDVIQDGVTGVFVPVGDARAMREAMVSLWNDPDRAERMGRAARAYVERHHSLDAFCKNVKNAVDASLDGHPASADGSFGGSSPAA